MKGNTEELIRLSDEIAKLSNTIEKFMNLMAIYETKKQETDQKMQAILASIIEMLGGDLKKSLVLYDRIMRKPFER